MGVWRYVASYRWWDAMVKANGTGSIEGGVCKKWAQV